jgi:YesN/AraC family two-component response regulator
MLHNKPGQTENRQSILIADDNDFILRLLSKGFKKFGFNVFEAKNGVEAWNLFNKEQVDFVLTDICMPGLEGNELSYLIRNQSPGTIIAVMTGSEFDIASDLLRDGTANYFFPKPFNFMDIHKSFTAENRVTSF